MELTDLGDRPIVALYWPDGESWVKLGNPEVANPVTSIERIWIHGMGSETPWFEVTNAEGSVSRYNAAHIESVEYGPAAS